MTRKEKYDKYWTYNGDDTKIFLEIEKDFYKDNFSEHLEYQNQKYAKKSHKNKIKTMEQYYKGAYTCPEDKILQIGNINKHATGEELWECALEYQKRFDEKWGDRCKILDMALHMDEATPHVHVRRVWIGENENGQKRVSQTNALEMLENGRPNMSKRNGKYNNEKMVFTKMDLKMFYDICVEHGLDVEEKSVRTSKRKVHLFPEDYKSVQISNEIGEEIEREYKVYSNAVSKKTDYEFMSEIKTKINDGEQIPVDELLEYEIRRQRLFAKTKGRYNQYQADLLEYISEIRNSEKIKNEDNKSDGENISSISNEKIKGINDISIGDYF